MYKWVKHTGEVPWSHLANCALLGAVLQPAVASASGAVGGPPDLLADVAVVLLLSRLRPSIERCVTSHMLRVNLGERPEARLRRAWADLQRR